MNRETKALLSEVIVKGSKLNKLEEETDQEYRTIETELSKLVESNQAIQRCINRIQVDYDISTIDGTIFYIYIDTDRLNRIIIKFGNKFADGSIIEERGRFGAPFRQKTKALSVLPDLLKNIRKEIMNVYSECLAVREGGVAE